MATVEPINAATTTSGTTVTGASTVNSETITLTNSYSGVTADANALYDAFSKPAESTAPKMKMGSAEIQTLLNRCK